MSVKISELTEATSVGSSDVLPLVQNGTTKKVTKETLTGETYSTTEQRVGTWIDGKPLYEQVLTGATPTVTSNGTSASEVADIGASTRNYVDKCFIIVAYVIYSNGQSVWTMPYYNNSMYYIKAQCYFSSDTNNWKIQVVSNGTVYNNSTYVVIVRYTKTADTATRSLNTLNTASLNASLMNTGSLVGLGNTANLNLANSIIEPTKEEAEENTAEPTETTENNEGSGDFI